VRVALVQLNSGDLLARNLAETRSRIDQAARGGAGFVLTPEVTNIVSTDHRHQSRVLETEQDDQILAALRAQARNLGIWLLIGSLAVKTDDRDGRFANRSFLIEPNGEIAARYDKIHMFDVVLSQSEVWRESMAYRPGNRAVTARTPFAHLGLSICYDVRFPHLYRAMSKAGAWVLTIPSAFSPLSGQAHWHTLLRARAIENGCYILAPAQCGAHGITTGKPRSTYGHSLAVNPWGEVIADAGANPGVVFLDIEKAEADEARSRIPSLTHDLAYKGVDDP